jgi:hypothetical protein
MRKKTFHLLTLSLMGLLPMQASTIFLADVDTSSVAGTIGFLDFTFDPGPLITQSAFASISSFSSDGTLGTPVISGGVTGSLTSSITLNNDTAFNDYFIPFTFGDTLNFLVTLGGPALDSSDSTSTSGSTFSFSMFAGDGSTPLLTSDSTDGFAFLLNVNLDGTTRLSNSSGQTSVSAVGASVPEPTGALLLAAGLIALRALGGSAISASWRAR